VRELSNDAPVLIAGGGLVGLSMAMFLARQGVRSTVVEQLKAPSTLPRAAFFHMRTFELFRAAGIEEQVKAQSEKEFVPDGAIVALESLVGPQIGAFIPNLNAGVEELSPCRRWFVSQPGLEPILRRRTQEVGAHVINGEAVVAAAQDSDGVNATLRNVETGAERTLRARYLIAAEGAHSRIREQLGLRMQGRGVFSNSITIYFRADLAPYLEGRNLSIIYVKNPVLSGFFRLEKNGQRGFLGVNTVGDPYADPEAAANAAADTSETRQIELVRAAAGVPDLKVELEGCARWRASSDVAERYREERIFFAGDAAHLMPPNGGFGGNTGIHDAHNLAWKIAMVLNGTAGHDLLDTYEIERKPVGRMTVDQAYTRYVTRTAPYLGAKDYPPLLDDFRIELGYLYRSRAVQSETGAPDGHEDPRTSCGRPGSRAPHLWLDDGHTSTLDLIGSGFTLLAAENGAAWCGVIDAVKKQFPNLLLECHTMDEKRMKEPKRFAHAYGLSDLGVALIRPDGFVAWRTASMPPDPVRVLQEVLKDVLCCG
jgi:2-polyprenyl-6-methoxyphenol hydroxylase-like FAD-dependent oxidoreductase